MYSMIIHPLDYANQIQIHAVLVSFQAFPRGFMLESCQSCFHLLHVVSSDQRVMLSSLCVVSSILTEFMFVFSSVRAEYILNIMVLLR